MPRPSTARAPTTPFEGGLVSAAARERLVEPEVVDVLAVWPVQRAAGGPYPMGGAAKGCKQLPKSPSTRVALLTQQHTREGP